MDNKKDALEKQTPTKTEDLGTDGTLAQYPDVKEKWDLLSSPEEKIQLAITVMRETLSQKDSPLFKKFWDMRKISLRLFKEAIHPTHRAKLWEEFLELSNEARNLKILFEEKSSFAIEQISLAVSLVEKDIKNASSLLASSPHLSFEQIEDLQENASFYEEKQKELHLLNTLSSRISALRKELIHTTMRMKEKNNLFKRLSSLAEEVFPRRKQLMEEVSTKFSSDVESFFSKYFASGNKIPFYLLKDKIKAMQKAAKQLTLTSEVFRNTREKLSSSWNQIKEKEKSRKEKIQERRQQAQEKKEPILASIKDLAEKKKQLPAPEFSRQKQALLLQVKKSGLRKEDLEELEKELRSLVEESDFAGKKQIDLGLETRTLDHKIQRLLEEKEKMPLEDLYDRLAQVERQIEKAGTSFAEKSRLKKLLSPVRDWIHLTLQEKVQGILTEKQAAKQEVRDLLSLMKKMRIKMKQLVEEQRRRKGAGGFNFEMAMDYQESFENEKKRVEAIEISIEELEDYIEQV